MSTAFESYDLSGTSLSNRIVMAPMTRSRAYGEGNSPTELMAEYYAQRASAGLIVTEGTQPSAIGQGYPDTPARLKQNGPFNTPDRATSFGGDHTGYTDYPTLN